MTAAEYHANPALSHSKIEDLLRCPSLFYGRHIAKTIPPWEGTEETELGSALHKLILEGSEAFDRDVAIWRGGMVDGKKKGDPPHHSMRRGTKAWDAFAEEVGRRTIISEPDNDAIERFASAIHASSQAQPLVFHPERKTEHNLAWTIPLGDGSEIPCKARLDGLIEVADALFDLKTTQCLTLDEHRRQAIKLGYHRKAEWYQRGYFQTRGHNARSFTFVSVRTVFDPVVWVWRFDDHAQLVAEIEIDLALDDYRSRMLTGDWSPVDCHGLRSIGGEDGSIRPYEYSRAVHKEMERRQAG